jgi:hypothetical protein
VGLSGCSSISEKIMGPASELPGIGLPADAPARPADLPAYPAVHDMPPPRSGPTLTGMEQKQMEDDLVAAREQQMKLVGHKPASKDAAKDGVQKGRKDAKNGPNTVTRSEPMYVPPQPASKPAVSGIY